MAVTRRRVLITGVSSDAGRLLVQRFRAEDNPPLIVVCSRQTPSETLDFLQIDGAAAAMGDVVALQANPSEEDGQEAFAEALARAPHGGAEFDAVVNLIGAWFARPGRDDPRQILLGGATVSAKSVKPRGPDFLPPRYVLTSSTSIYGNRPGEILTEEMPFKPDSSTRFAGWQVEVEQVMKNFHKEKVVDLVTLRCPHIYGTPKEKTINRYRDGTMIVMGTGQNIMQHIHYHDYVQGLALASGVLPSGRPPSGDYNLVDDTTETYAEYCKFITDWCRQPTSKPMSLEECLQTGCLKDLLGPAFGREATVKEVFTPITFSAQFDNSKVKKDLGLVLKYPTYRQGLAVLMLAMDWQAAGWKDGNVWTDSQVGPAANVDGGYADPQPAKPSGESAHTCLKSYAPLIAVAATAWLLGRKTSQMSEAVIG